MELLSLSCKVRKLETTAIDALFNGAFNMEDSVTVSNADMHKRTLDVAWKTHDACGIRGDDFVQSLPFNEQFEPVHADSQISVQSFSLTSADKQQTAPVRAYDALFFTYNLCPAYCGRFGAS